MQQTGSLRFYFSLRTLQFDSLFIGDRPSCSQTSEPAGREVTHTSCVHFALLYRHDRADRLGYTRKRFSFTLGDLAALCFPHLLQVLSPTLYSSRCCLSECIYIFIYVCACVCMRVRIPLRIPFRFLHTNFAGGAFFRSQEPSKRGRSLISVGCQQ